MEEQAEQYYMEAVRQIRGGRVFCKTHDLASSTASVPEKGLKGYHKMCYMDGLGLDTDLGKLAGKNIV